MNTVRFLLISGSLRAGSSNAALLKTALELLPPNVNAELYGGLAALPHFNPDNDTENGPLHPAVLELRQRMGEADALLFSTPEYAGALPGSFKNLLDWTVGGGELYQKPVAWINAATLAAPTGGADAHASLRKVLGYLDADIAEPACTRIPIERRFIKPDGRIYDPKSRKVLAETSATLAAYVH